MHRARARSGAFFDDLKPLSCMGRNKRGSLDSRTKTARIMCERLGVRDVRRAENGVIKAKIIAG